MENRSSYTIVGAFFILCVLAVCGFFIWMTTKTDARATYRSYYIHTKELPNGLKEDAQVKFIGVPAGIVKSIGFYDVNKGIIEIELSLKSKFPVSTDSKAEIQTQGISGVTSINITKGTGKAFGSDVLKPVIAIKEGLLDKISSKAETITDRIDETLKKINSVLSKENLDKFNNTVASIEEFSKLLKDPERFKKIDNLIASLDNITASIDKNKSKFIKLLETSTKTINSFNATQNLIKERIQRGDYNIREIVSPTLLETKKTLVEFNRVLRELEGSLMRLEDDPYDFFFRDTKNKGEK